MTQPEPSTPITLREVYDLVLELKSSMAALIAVAPKMEDHEARIRTLEHAKWTIAGICTALGAAAGFIAAAIGK